MRIIDKNTDFYDYLQNIYSDNTFTFDRTDSFVLTKEIMCKHLDAHRSYSRHTKKDRKYHNFVLLQICNTFWLFVAELTKIDKYGLVQDYTLDLLTTWRNYDKPRVLCSLDVIKFGYQIGGQIAAGSGFLFEGYDAEKMRKKIDVLMQAINTNDYKIENRIDHHVIYYGDYDNKVEKHIPLLKACGIASLVDPLDIFLAFEEYFSLEKTASERRDPVGTTDNDKIESHGFDTKTSFRGKIVRK